MLQVINLENIVITLSLTTVTVSSYSSDCNPNSPSVDSNAVCCLHICFLWWNAAVQNVLVVGNEKDICTAHCEVDIVEEGSLRTQWNVTFLSGILRNHAWYCQHGDMYQSPT